MWLSFVGLSPSYLQVPLCKFLLTQGSTPGPFLTRESHVNCLQISLSGGLNCEKTNLYNPPVYLVSQRHFILFLKRFYLLFRERQREGEKPQYARETWIGCLSPPPTGDLPCNPGVCSEGELNPWSLGLQAGAQSTEPHQPGCKGILISTCPKANPLSS